MLPPRMSFGKHRGRLVEDVPTQYLRWCLRECECLDDWLRDVIAEELGRRQCRPGGPARGREAPGRSQPGKALVDLPSLIRTWHREMALKYHPDRGGSHEAMTAIAFAYDRLKQLAGVA
jgi:uncharacterized protein (DUF3820 family)